MRDGIEFTAELAAATATAAAASSGRSAVSSEDMVIIVASDWLVFVVEVKVWDLLQSLQL